MTCSHRATVHAFHKQSIGIVHNGRQYVWLSQYAARRLRVVCKGGRRTNSSNGVKADENVLAGGAQALAVGSSEDRGPARWGSGWGRRGGRGVEG